MNKVLLFSLIVSTLGATETARALSCAEELDVVPAHNAQAPRNTRVWLSTSDANTFRWTDDKGSVVSFSRVRIAVGSGFVDVLTADELLTFPGTYRVESCRGEDMSFCKERTVFSTVDEIDSQPPMRPEIRDARRITERDAEWGDTRVVRFTVAADAILVLDAQAAGGESPFAAGSQLARLSSHNAISVGEAPCLPPTFEGESGDVRFGTFDLAGNFSGFGETVHVDKPDFEGCALGSSGDVDWTCCLLAALLLRRRRYSASLP